MKAVLTPRALRELSAAVGWIARDNKTAARGLRGALAKALETIGDYPDIGLERADLAALPTRFLVLSGYPYILAYNSARRPVVVRRVVHAARDLPTVFGGL